MKPKTLLIILSIIGTCVLASQGDAANCKSSEPAVPPIGDEHFDIDMIPDGTWHIQEIFVRTAEEVVEPPACLQQYITYPGLLGHWGFHQTYVNETSGGTRWPYINLLFLTSSGKSSWSLLYSILDSDSVAVWGHTDNAHYGILYFCPTDNSYDTRERVVILTRAAAPGEPLLSVLEAIVEGYGFPKEHAVRIDHSNSPN